MPGNLPRLLLDRENAAAEGSGLGLAICSRLATAMGGEVDLIAWRRGTHGQPLFDPNLRPSADQIDAGFR